MKRPKDSPNAVGQRVELRGRGFVGTVSHYDPVSEWTRVNWDDANGVKVCHAFELKVID